MMRLHYTVSSGRFLPISARKGIRWIVYSIFTANRFIYEYNADSFNLPNFAAGLHQYLDTMRHLASSRAPCEKFRSKQSGIVCQCADFLSCSICKYYDIGPITVFCPLENNKLFANTGFPVHF
jgi:hypothetical protein